MIRLIIGFLFVASLTLASLASAAMGEDLVRIDLARHAKLTASHATPGEEFAPANAIDSNLETKWVGEAHPLTLHPTNLVLQFDAPGVVRRVVLVSTVFRDNLALKDFELYAGVGGGWDGESP